MERLECISNTEYLNPLGYPLPRFRLTLYSEAIAAINHKPIPLATGYIWIRLELYSRRILQALNERKPWIRLARSVEKDAYCPKDCYNDNADNAWLQFCKIDGTDDIVCTGNLHRAVYQVLLAQLGHLVGPFAIYSESQRFYPKAWERLMAIYTTNSRPRSTYRKSLGKAFLYRLLIWEPEIFSVMRSRSFPLPAVESDWSIAEAIWEQAKLLDHKSNSKQRKRSATYFLLENQKFIKLPDLLRGSQNSFDEKMSEDPHVLEPIREKLFDGLRRHGNSKLQRAYLASRAVDALKRIVYSTMDDLNASDAWAQYRVREWMEESDNLEATKKRGSSDWKDAPTWLYVFRTVHAGFYKIGIACSIQNRISSPNSADLYAKEVLRIQLPTRAWALAVETMALKQTLYAANSPGALRSIPGWTEVRELDEESIVALVRELTSSALNWERPVDSWLAYQCRIGPDIL